MYATFSHMHRLPSPLNHLRCAYVLKHNEPSHYNRARMRMHVCGNVNDFFADSFMSGANFSGIVLRSLK